MVVVVAVSRQLGDDMAYYEMLIEQLLGGGGPEYGGDQGRRTAAADASLLEDAMLRYKMGGKRKLGEKEKMPSGSYALAEYPGLRYDIDNASRGANPRGGMYSSFVIPGLAADDRMQELRRKWAQVQGSMMPQGNFVSRMGGR